MLWGRGYNLGCLAGGCVDVCVCFGMGGIILNVWQLVDGKLAGWLACVCICVCIRSSTLATLVGGNIRYLARW